MLGWWIFLGILVLFVLLLCIPVRLVVRYRTGSHPLAYLGWLLVKYDLTTDETKPAKKKRAKKIPAEKAEQPPPKKPESPQSFADKLGVITDLLVSLKDNAGMVVRRFRIYKLELNMLVGGEDAAQTAITYGQVNAAVYSAYGLAGRVFNMTTPSIDIRPSFTCEQSDILFELRARLMPIVLLGFALRAGVQFLVRIVRRGAQDKANRCPDRKDRPDRPLREERAERADRETRDDRATRGDREARAEREPRDDRKSCDDRKSRGDRAAQDPPASSPPNT